MRCKEYENYKKKHKETYGESWKPSDNLYKFYGKVKKPFKKASKNAGS